MSNIEKIDKNFAALAVSFEGMTTYNVRKAPFSIHGLYQPEDGAPFRRIPREVAASTNPGVLDLHGNTAGGRIRFKTDSNRVVLKWIAPYVRDFSHMPRTGAAYFDLYANGEHIHAFLPTEPTPTENGVILESMMYLPFGGMRDITIHFPSYNDIIDVSLALDETATALPPDPYTHSLPVVFYGSSITQGGCASRGGTAYPSMLAQMLDIDFINLGFSGSCGGELTMADYIATLPMSVFVLDYDHNAGNPEQLNATHEPFFKRLRELRPDLPVIMISAADYYLPGGWEVRRNIIRTTYENAIANGDHNVYFLDGHTFYDAVGAQFCRVDHTHPNDLGMWCMAKAIAPVLKNLL